MSQSININRDNIQTIYDKTKVNKNTNNSKNNKLNLNLLRYYYHLDIVNTKNNMFFYLFDFLSKNSVTNTKDKELEYEKKHKKTIDNIINALNNQNTLKTYTTILDNIEDTTLRGDSFICSTGHLGFKKSSRSKKHASLAIVKKMKQFFKKRKKIININYLVISVRGISRNLRPVIRSINNIKGIRIIRLKDKTRIPFGGTRSKKMRRL